MTACVVEEDVAFAFEGGLAWCVPDEEALLGEPVAEVLLFGLALVSMMLFRPAGLWPSSIRRRELAAPREPAGAEGADVPR